MELGATNEPEAILIDDWEVFFDNDSAEGAKLTDLLTDQPVTLDDCSPEDLDRLQLHFFGWTHDGHTDRIERLSKKIEECNPDIIIFEQVGGSKERRQWTEFILNTSYREVPFGFKSPSTGIQDPIKLHPVTDYSMTLDIASRLNHRPLLRMMDMSDEELAAHNLSVHGPDRTLPSYLPTTSSANRHAIRDEIKTQALERGASDKLREIKLYDDISRISANMLQKSTGECSIAIVHGSAHTSMARRFQRDTSVATTLDFVEREPGKPFSWDAHVQAIREATYLSDVSEKSIDNEIIIDGLLIFDPEIQAMHATGTDAIAILSFASQKVNKLSPTQRHEIVAAWNQLNSKMNLSKRRRDNALMHAVQTLLRHTSPTGRTPFDNL